MRIHLRIHLRVSLVGKANLWDDKKTSAELLKRQKLSSDAVAPEKPKKLSVRSGCLNEKTVECPADVTSIIKVIIA